MANIDRALAEVQQTARSLGLTIEQDGDYLVLKAQGRNTSGGQSVPYNEDGIGYLKMILQQSGRTSAPATRHGCTARISRTETVFVLSFVGLLAAYTVGTFYPETRVITGPLTILFLILVSYYPVKLVMQYIGSLFK